MSTRSRIGMVLPNGNIKHIYCHSDGYPSYNGDMLVKHYQDPKKIASLLRHGDLSSLGAELGEKHGFDYRDRPENQCTFYRRDRGEKDVAAKVTAEKDFGEWCDQSDAEYIYLFKDGQWYVADNEWGNPELTFETVADVLAREQVNAAIELMAELRLEPAAETLLLEPPSN